MKLGIVTAVKKDPTYGTLIDIVGLDGGYYTDVPLFDTSISEAPVPSEIPDRSLIADDIMRDAILSGEFAYDPIESIKSSKFRTFVLFEEIKVFNRSKFGVFPIKFIKNWAQECTTVPSFKFDALPEPGGATIQAAGTEKIPGGFLKLDRNGNVKLTTGFSTVSLYFDNETGKVSVRYNSAEIQGAGFYSIAEKGTLTLTKKRYLPGIGYSPTDILSLLVNDEGVTLKQSLVDINVPNITITSKNEGSFEIRNVTGVTVTVKKDGSIEVKNTVASITIDTAGNIVIEGTKIEVKNKTGIGYVKIDETGKVSINGEQYSAVLAEMLTTALDSHIHSTPSGPSGPPMPSFSTISQSYTSQRVKLL